MSVNYGDDWNGAGYLPTDDDNSQMDSGYVEEGLLQPVVEKSIKETVLKTVAEKNDQEYPGTQNYTRKRRHAEIETTEDAAAAAAAGGAPDKFQTMKNGNFRMYLSNKSTMVMSLFKGKRYVHFWTDRSHVTLGAEEFGNLLLTVPEILQKWEMVWDTPDGADYLNGKR